MIMYRWVCYNWYTPRAVSDGFPFRGMYEFSLHEQLEINQILFAKLPDSFLLILIKQNSLITMFEIYTKWKMFYFETLFPWLWIFSYASPSE